MKTSFDKLIGNVPGQMGLVDAHVDTVEEMVERLVDDAMGPLDEYMSTISSVLRDPDHVPTDGELEDICMNLPALMYFIVDRKERLGIKEDLARAMRREAYNTTYDSMEGQVGPRKVAAELASQLEDMAEDVYERAHQKMDSKIWAATELLNSVKKVMSRRMNERF